MIYEFEAIKIEEKKLIEKTKEISCMYIVKFDYKSLIDICTIGKISINRDVEEDRAKKMVNYIKDVHAFYPPIIVATLKKNLIKYDSINNRIHIDSDKFVKNNDLIVIDGQHRFRSIELLSEENSTLIENRYQSVFLIDNINEFQQRKIFIDINNTSRKVTTGTKLRFEKNIINYISLNLVNNSEKIQQKITMDDNQTTTTDELPYKFIIRGNERLLKKIDSFYEKRKIKIDDIDNLLEIIKDFWEKVFEIIDESAKLECGVATNEAFYIALCEMAEEKFNCCIFDGEELEENPTGKFLESLVTDDLDKIKQNIEEINKEYYKRPLNKTKDRIDTLLNLMKKCLEGDIENA